MEAWIWASSIDKGLLELKSLISSPREACGTEDERSKGGGLRKSKIQGKVGMLQLEAWEDHCQRGKGETGKNFET